MKILAVVSGGMDSITMLHFLHRTYADVAVLSFDYGQRHRRELDCASFHARLLALPHRVANLPLSGWMPGSSLTDPNVPTPHGHYAEENMRQTVVPGRNGMMLAIAWGIAAANRAQSIATAVHAGDHHIYPDCRPDFIHGLEHALKLGTRGHAAPNMRIETPFLHMTKVEIVRLGLTLGVDYANTWTCYEGGDAACGRCGSCQERLAAFHELGVPDPAEYVSRDLIQFADE